MQGASPRATATISQALLSEYDPLGGPPILGDEPTSSTSSPLSFKRRTPSRGTGLKSGLLGNLLSRSEEEEDKVPPPAMKRPDAPTRIDLPTGAFRNREVSSSAFSSALDDEDDDPPPVQPAGKFQAKQRVPSNAFRGKQPMDERMRTPRGSNKWEQNPMSPGARQRYMSPGRSERGGGGGGGPGGLTSLAEEVTPLPLVPITVLCFALFGEFLSASTSSPFLYFMIESFGVGQGPDGGGEAAVGFWTGIVGSTFFLSQFMTSLLWVSVAEKHGRRAVLFASLFGNAITLVLFGTSKNLGTAISVRLCMGVFNGAVGVARATVQNLTDSTNESKAFTAMGLAWGLGGIVGSIIGGLAESPVKNHPYFFGDSVIFAEYPYLLPCLISGSVAFVGAILSLFLNPDGGPREGGIKLPGEKDVERAATSVFSIPRKLVNLLLHFLRPPHTVPLPTPSGGEVVPVPRPANMPIAEDPRRERNPFGMASPRPSGYGSAFNPLSVPRSARKASGSAYGYDQPRFPSGRRYTGRSAYRAASVAASTRYAPDFEDHQDLNFAQRLLMANEGAVFSISDLWVAAATQNDDQYSQADFDESVFDDEESRIEGEDVEGGEGGEEEPDFFGYGTAPPSMDDLRGTAQRQDEARGRVEGDVTPSSLAVPEVPTPSRRSPSRDRIVSYGGRSDRFRRGSVASSVRPSLYANTGLDAATLAAAHAPALKVPETPGESTFNPMAAIPETRPPSIVEIQSVVGEEDEKPEVSLMRQLPLAMIAQHALLALHGTTCDQVFMSFLVTPVPSGGLGLKASNYAVLVALMFFFSMVWQFKFYPFVNSSWSHLAMLRLGLFMYIPCYLLFPELRGLLHENGNGFVMLGMTILSALRYLGNTCAYTAISVLVNAMSPPHLVPLANGLSQSAVSLARFVGPILGGTLWAASISNGPNAHPYPFNYAAGFVAISIICFIGFCHSFRIH